MHRAKGSRWIDVFIFPEAEQLIFRSDQKFTTFEAEREMTITWIKKAYLAEKFIEFHLRIPTIQTLSMTISQA